MTIFLRYRQFFNNVKLPDGLCATDDDRASYDEPLLTTYLRALAADGRPDSQ